MQNKRLLLLPVLLLLTCMYGAAQNKTAMDHLNVPGPLVVGGQSFQLNWSAHPNATFYKQEYIRKGEPADRYKKMVLIDVLSGEANLKTLVATKIAELKQQQAGNPMVNYQTFDKSATGEYMIDFLLSAPGADGKGMSIVERNVYRYKAFKNKNGQQGVLLFGVSERAYGGEIDQFLKQLKAVKSKLLNEVGAYTLPEITIR